MLVDNTQHDGQQRHAEDIVAVGEETSAGNENCSDMIPAKWRFINFRKSKASSLIGVFDMYEVTRDNVSITSSMSTLQIDATDLWKL